MEDKEVEATKEKGEVEQIFDADQADRRIRPDSEILKRDHLRKQRVQEMLGQGSFQTKEEFNWASYIFQHGTIVEDVQKALELSKKAVELGYPPFASLVPSAFDRLMIYEQVEKGVPYEQAKQHYGTQSYTVDGKTAVNPLDGTVTEEELELYGLPKPEEYLGRVEDGIAQAFIGAKDRAQEKWDKDNPS